MEKAQSYNDLGSEKKEAIGLLSIGTFLEYFDLMLYVHMAILLNQIFFPETDPKTGALLSAFAFCSTYMLRPFGALVFGTIGDYLGRKPTIIITTLIMSLCCVTIGSLPTYAQIGISASYVITICRMLQGMAANAESRGAELYITESFKPPLQYPLVALITLFSAFGTTAALGISSIFTNEHLFGNNEFAWRMAFYVGAIVGLVGTVARTSLKEASDYANKKKSIKNKLRSHNISWTEHEEISFRSNKPDAKTSFYYFFIHCARPPCFYFVYIYCGDILKYQFGFSPHHVIQQNFFVSIVDLFGLMVLVYLSSKYYPLKILKVKLYLFFASIISFPFIMDAYPSPNIVFIYQCLAALFVFDHIPATPIFFSYFPILKRFTYTSLISAIAKLLTYFITSFGLVYTTKYFGYYGIFIILIPIGIMFYISVNFFERKEKLL